MKRSIALAGIGGTLAIAALAGCSQPATPAKGTPSAGPNDVASSQPAAPDTGTPSAGPNDVAGGQPGGGQPATAAGSGNAGGGSGAGTGAGTVPAECPIGKLDIRITGGDAAVGNRSRIIVFRNTGTKTCVLQGYPGVAALDSRGHQVAQAQRTLNGYLGGVRTGKPLLVWLAPGKAASAMVEAAAFRANGASCTGYAGLLVTPPDETHSARLSWGSDGCSHLQIHPVVPGTTGRSG
jgi:hypothetical protein